uniref:4'-phosphopantetheinyl transferase superfamily protein n=1 Tax=uncultured bacterium CSL142 TaxID=1091569 RepID=G4WVL7_9BACT|nr:4'-phosphopantetheinyl transferase superfamily protein [uncultured bacterium CSL142]
MREPIRVMELAQAGNHSRAASLGSSIIERITFSEPEVAAWKARLDLAPELSSKYVELLSADEYARAQRFRCNRERRRYVVARAILRVLLASYLDVRPNAITFGYTQTGKPFIVNPATGLNFNVSHSAARALYAFSYDCHVGVDIEYLHQDCDYTRVAALFFSDRERGALQRLPRYQHKRMFFTYWTLKEALVKAMGFGLSALTQFELTLTQDQVPHVVNLPAAAGWGSDWALRSVDAEAGYIAAIAITRLHSRRVIGGGGAHASEPTLRQYDQ